jgi:hypothetical protein
MQDIYNYIPETNHVPRVYSVAVVLYLQWNGISSMKYILYSHISTFRSMSAVPNMAFFFWVP